MISIDVCIIVQIYVNIMNGVPVSWYVMPYIIIVHVHVPIVLS